MKNKKAFVLWSTVFLMIGSMVGAGIVEYFVQCYAEDIFSGSVAVLFYLSAVVAIAIVAKELKINVVFQNFATIRNRNKWGCIYERNVYKSTQGFLISGILIVF